MPFRNIDDPAKLRRLLEVVMLLESDLSLGALLRHLVEEACALVTARYGALGVLSEDRTSLSEFITVGLDDAAERAVGARPTGMGILGLLITEPEPIRIADIATHSERSGFPPRHPPMTSFLGVPVMTHDVVYGNLYLTDKIGAAEFTGDDEEMVKALAAAAGVAIESARLHQQVRDAVVLEDRDRIARDLHDTVIQRLFAIGLSLQGTAKTLAADSAPAGRVRSAIDDIDETIRQIRSSIFELSTAHQTGTRNGLLSLVRDLELVVGCLVRVSFAGPVDTAIDSRLSDQLLHIAREALTNVGRHSGATSVELLLDASPTDCQLTVADNGHGINDVVRAEGLGIRNMRQRAEKLGGRLEITSSDRGTVVRWRVPLSP